MRADQDENGTCNSREVPLVGTPVIVIVPPRASARWRILRSPLARVTLLIPVRSSTAALIRRPASRGSTRSTTFDRPRGYARHHNL